MFCKTEILDVFYHVGFSKILVVDYLFSLRTIILFLGSGGSQEISEDRRFRLILWAIAAGTRGGPNRVKILNLLYSKILNENQISKELNLDHKTVHHHLEILIKNSLIKKLSEESYDIKYDLTPIMRKNHLVLEEIISKIKR